MWIPLLAVAACLSGFVALAAEAAAASGPSAAEVSAKLDEVRGLLPDVVARATEWSLPRSFVWQRVRVKLERVVRSGQPVSIGLLRYLAQPVVNRAIEEHLLGAAAAAEGFPADSARAEGHLAELLGDPRSREQVEGFLRENGLSRDEYVRELAARTAIMDWARQRFVVKQEVSEDELRQSYRKRLPKLALPATLRLERILVARTEGGATQAEERLAGIRQTVAEGAPFAEAWRRQAAYVHYDSQRIAVQSLPEQVQDVVGGLAAGEVSGIVELPDTLALIRWSDPVPGWEPTFEQVREILRTNVQEDKGREAFSSFLAELRRAQKVVVYPPLEESRTIWPTGAAGPARQ
jgi:hypothetical protein